MAATETFQSLERDVTSIINSVQKTVAEQLPQTSGEQKNSTVRLAQRELDAARDLASQLEVELRNQPSANRTTYTTRVQTLRRQIDTLATTLSKAGQERAGSYGAVGTGYAPNTAEDGEVDPQRQRLLVAQGRLSRTSNTLQASQRIAAETEAIGTGILSELHAQRDTIVRASDQLHETNANLSRSNKILGRMGRRAIAHKCITALICLLFLAILGLVLFLKLS
eukprot:comp23266_c0_seq1/m.38057 comp23266_c0_seq1/g.38057  ORF comp23266_c0_seq1/g.38057 comp23266_c0_seq1/m.38057 type:complete len:224 (-) comp23266_c0_seq1:528-1199(-)